MGTFANKGQLQDALAEWCHGCGIHWLTTKWHCDTHEVHGDIRTWNVSAVTNMVSLIYVGAFPCVTHFDEDVNAWDVGQVTSMNGLFYGASKFNQHLSAWNTALGRVIVEVQIIVAAYLRVKKRMHAVYRIHRGDFG